MYPDTDSPPIPLQNSYIENLKKNLPDEVIQRYHKLKEWRVPENTYNYIFSKNLFPIITKITNELSFNPRFIGNFLGHTLKFIEGHYKKGKDFDYNIIFNLFKYIKENNLNPLIARKMLPIIYEHPQMDFDSVMTTIKFKIIDKQEIINKIPYLKEKFSKIAKTINHKNEKNWIMGHLREIAIGNIDLKELSEKI